MRAICRDLMPDPHSDVTLCFYGHPSLSTWFTSEYKKRGKKLDMGP